VKHGANEQIQNAIIVWCFYPETGGLQLEAVDRLFVKSEGDDMGLETDGAFYRKMQWSMVGKSVVAVRRARMHSADISGGSVVSSRSSEQDKMAIRHIESVD